MRSGQNHMGLGGRAGGREWSGSIKAGRLAGEKSRWQSQGEPPDRNLGMPQGSRDPVRSDLLRVAMDGWRPKGRASRAGRGITNHSNEKDTSNSYLDLTMDQALL